ncbi:MAG: hypothetical protein ABIT83_25855 [Massilia sp.]
MRGLALLPVSFALTCFMLFYFSGHAGGGESVADPLTDFHTRAHGDAYGGIDRWAYFGMPAERVAERLRRDGYACDTASQAASGDVPPDCAPWHAASKWAACWHAS